MKITKLSFISIAIYLLTPLWAVAQASQVTPDALDLLKSVAETYRVMMTFQAEQNNVMEMNSPNMQQKIEMPGTLAFDSKGRMRMESKGATAMSMVFDGQLFWMYMPQVNRYMKITVPKPSATGQEAGAAQLSGMGGFGSFGANFTTLATRVQHVTVLRSESLHVEGTDVPCWVVSAEYESPQASADSATGATASAKSNFHNTTVWLDKEHFLVYKEVTDIEMTVPGSASPMKSKTTTTFSHIIVDGPLPEDTFTFTPPSGATEMDFSAFMPKSQNPPQPQK